MNKITIPEGLKGKELFKFLIENKHLLITQKKSAVKQSDSVTCKNLYVNSKGEITKAAPKPTDTGVIEVVSVINTTNLMDSHDDVHIPGIWNRNLKQNNKTEALIFTSLVEENRNKFMYDLYKADEVPNHSVGMQYVNLLLAINDEDFKEEFANWNEYIDQVANKDDAEENGFFWPVLEAKVVEGAAVIKGSNWVTPTLEVDAKSLNTDEPDPLKGTQQHRPFDVSEAIKKTKFF
jgi:hypothetical protein